MNDVTKEALSKVPAVTLGFWVIKILATTLGETGGDTVTMTLDWGYLAGVTLFGVVLVALVDGAGMPKVAAQAIAIVAGTPLSFLGQKLWSFKA